MVHRSTAFAFLLFLLFPLKTGAYGILSHLAMIDATWDNSIVPVLLSRYPDKNDPETLKRAKAFAYGGAIMPDMGYFPKGDELFTDLIHYVRTGDFVSALLEEAKDINELSFAMGIMAHYVSDEYGHSIGINPVVPLLYKKTRKKFGDTVTYEDNPIDHLRVEFSFDVMEVAKGDYFSSSYHAFIGFEIPKEHLDRAFKKTYGIDISVLMPHYEQSVRFFRWTVIDFFPKITRVAWRIKRKGIDRTLWKVERKKMVYRFHQKRHWKSTGELYKTPGLLARIIADLIKVVPKPGDLKAFSFKPPTPTAYKKFESSFEVAYENYCSHLKNIPKEDQELKNINWDTGHLTIHHSYCLADKCYYKLLMLHKQKKFECMNAALRKNIYSFYNTNRGSNSERIQLLLSEMEKIQLE